MDDIKQMAKTVAECIKGDTKKTKAYDTAAKVKRIENGTAYVEIPGGVSETPVKLTIDAKVGDTVQVHVGNGTAWLVGNQTAPPTDDAEALIAKAVAKVADKTANKAKTTAEQAETTANAVSGIANNALTQAQEAKQIADDTEQHFWFTETGTDTGAHITEVTQEEWNDPSDPNYQSGGNLLARSNGIAVREGMKELATMSKDGFEAISYDSGGIPVPIVHLGYGPGTNSAGGTSDAPYYDLGVRLSGSTKGNYSTAEGYNNTASGYVSHAEGILTTAIGTGSHAEGYSTTASDYYCHAEGHSTTASADYCHAEGHSTTASGDYSHAEGNDTTASGTGAHTEGYSTTANDYSHAEGYDTTASGNYSHSEGNSTTASNYYSHAEGYDTTASGFASHTQNRSTVAGYDYQTAIGKYNDNKSGDLFEIGNGTDYARSNAFEVKQTGGIIAGGLPSGLLAEEVVLADNKSITGNNYGNGNKSVSKTGYTPIGIVGMHLENATSGGTLNTYCMLHSFYLSGTTAYWIVRNTNSSAAKIKVTATILYIKS